MSKGPNHPIKYAAELIALSPGPPTSTTNGSGSSGTSGTTAGSTGVAVSNGSSGGGGGLADWMLFGLAALVVLKVQRDLQHAGKGLQRMHLHAIHTLQRFTPQARGVVVRR